MTNTIGENRLGLLPITNQDNSECQGHIVFVHGLMGHPITTWYPKIKMDQDFKKNKYKNINDDIDSKAFWDNHFHTLEFWPNWLAKERPDMKIWSYGYNANFRGDTLSILETGSNLRSRIENKELAEKPIIFIAYSLGGIIVKQMLQTAFTLKDNSLENQQIINIPKGIVFLATPHTEPSLSKFVKQFEGLPVAQQAIQIATSFISASQFVNALRNEQDKLTETNLFYKNNHKSLNIRTKAFYEKNPINGLMIVEKDEADPGILGEEPTVAEDTDHETIAKPESWNPNNIIQETLLSLINKVIKSHSTYPSSSPTRPRINLPHNQYESRENSETKNPHWTL
ncbi:esterase/lipase family protein [Crocosphaera chwakensis]|uniref:DUF676 domain-containing protein n=1 Tax=Crocosphaera chwakensis CCY0110 TaxID=391612 RepID=A3IPI0_9CHRO|nr:hypothetical protein [Crocosphaera chwakensis]EAZ91745.1 hypothetical protein CY0110_26478 [Crocosphaera chwakensis CCY0110]